MAAQCNLIIDSCCDLPLSMLQIEGVDTLNFNYVMSDGDHEDDFYQSITPHEFYEKIRNGETPSTSQASPAAIEAAWRRAAENGIPTVYLCFSSGLSSNYSTAAALLAQVKEEFPDAPLYLVDLMIGSTPEGLLVLEALRQRDSGLPQKSWSSGPNRRATSCKPLSWLTILMRCTAADAFPHRLPQQARHSM